jgi:hypothetical protein
MLKCKKASSIVVKKDGAFGLYAGFIPIWARFAPTATLQLVLFEQIKPILGLKGNGEQDH